MTNATVWFPARPGGPGELREVDIDAGVTATGIETESVVGIDLMARFARGERDLRCGHGFGGGPLAMPAEALSAARFGLVNAVYHAERAMSFARELLGMSLPRVTIRIGVHDRWGGGHYRLPAKAYSDRPETVLPSPNGEVHLGRGSRYLIVDGERYFNAAAHNAAIVYHEVGHHLCRHSADFRLNGARARFDQTNAKTPLDEGTADFFAATLLGYPDIYGWHRGHVPHGTQARRCLDAPWTMADFRGGHDQDPHTDGAVWAASLWAARLAAVDAGVAVGTFDRFVGAALKTLGTPTARSKEALRERRHLSRAAVAVIGQAAAHDARAAARVRAAFADRGIVAGYSNAELRDRARAADRREAVLV